jgi:hypothetical protein
LRAIKRTKAYVGHICQKSRDTLDLASHDIHCDSQNIKRCYVSISGNTAIMTDYEDAISERLSGYDGKLNPWSN